MVKDSFFVKYGFYILTFLLLLPLIILRDFTPANELRYLSIADDALEYHRFFTFYNHGQIYADKPPLYLWIIMLGKTIFGSHQMWFLSLSSLIPAFVIMATMDKWIHSQSSVEHRICAKFLLMTAAFYLGSAIILRMDMMMSMFITLSLYHFYKMYSGKDKERDKWLLPVFIFMGIFTKGPVGFIIPVFSITIFLLIKGKINTIGKYLGYRTWKTLLGLCIIWFALVWFEGGKIYLNDLLLNQTFNRAVDAFHHKEPFYYYSSAFWYSFAPWSLQIFFLVAVGIKKRLIKTDIEKLFLIVIITSFVFLSLVSSKIEIYMLPTFPFWVYLSVMVLRRLDNPRWLAYMIATFAVSFVLTLPVFLIVEHNLPFGWIDELRLTLIIGLACFGIFGLIALYYTVLKKNIINSMNCLSLGLLVLIFVISLKLPVLNNYLGYRDLCENGVALSDKSGSYIVYRLNRSESMNIYLGEPVLEVDETDILSGNYNGYILFLSEKAIKNNISLDEYLKEKNTKKIGNKIVVKL